MLPMVDRAPPDLPTVPAAPHEQGRLFAIGLPTERAPMPLHDDGLAPAQKPRMTRIGAPLLGEGLPTGRAAPPVPRCAPREIPQRLEKATSPFYDIHPGSVSIALGSSPTILPQPCEFHSPLLYLTHTL